MFRKADGARRVLRARSDDHRNFRLNQMLDAFHTLLVAQQGPVAHRAAIDHCGHACADQPSCGGDQCGMVGGAIGPDRGHEGRDDAFENLG